MVVDLDRVLQDAQFGLKLDTAALQTQGEAARRADQDANAALLARIEGGVDDLMLAADEIKGGQHDLKLAADKNAATQDGMLAEIKRMRQEMAKLKRSASSGSVSGGGAAATAATAATAAAAEATAVAASVVKRASGKSWRSMTSRRW